MCVCVYIGNTKYTLNLYYKNLMLSVLTCHGTFKQQKCTWSDIQILQKQTKKHTHKKKF